jgi:hypothetical protein
MCIPQFHDDLPRFKNVRFGPPEAMMAWAFFGNPKAGDEFTTRPSKVAFGASWGSGHPAN